MGAQQREYKKRISSATGMKKIFQAQEMIAAARISKAHARVLATTPYADAITDAIASVVKHTKDAEHPFLVHDRTSSNRVGVLLITADRGMAGSYSPSAIREAEMLGNKLRKAGKEPVMYVVGRKGESYYRFRNRPPHKAWTGIREEEMAEVGLTIARELRDALLSEDPSEHLDELYVVGHKFHNRFRQEPRIARLVPLSLHGDDQAAQNSSETFPLYEYSPDPESVFAELVPRYVESRIINILLQSIASEHASRQKAMKTATDNAETQIQKFTRLANSARQAEITQEITEIVGGADALSSSGRKER
ncbi:F0F1 ATP synthase subunit gamma [Helcobacillus sp. ACRRO]|uniref:F0F1 ATP synthase subunit gamma n=1 Tax=Helcobacillus sp. ACRRO TaxID=2918202 RepID=UPI001EF5FD59|nr:F0F1 ATP synthase subunit gamma [Helcobacillus sp. ACRRO]MCG7426811.1 F0F1 ATP synthase subunit gamma [Helcobacillus sp. ACRRO]